MSRTSRRTSVHGPPLTTRSCRPCRQPLTTGTRRPPWPMWVVSQGASDAIVVPRSVHVGEDPSHLRIVSGVLESSPRPAKEVGGLDSGAGPVLRLGLEPQILQVDHYEASRARR